jgi:opacity protein-like surface antigen
MSRSLQTSARLADAHLSVRSLLGSIILFVSTALPLPAAAFDANTTFAKGTYVLSGEGSYGEQFNREGFSELSDLKLWNVGLRASILPFGVTGPGVLRGAVEAGLEPLYQRTLEPHSAFWAGLIVVARYHFLTLGRFVPYVEVAGGPGGTDLEVREIDSNFSFVVWGGAGISLFLTDTTAIYAGYRYEHNSNAGTATPNRGLDFHVAVFGVSYYVR